MAAKLADLKALAEKFRAVADNPTMIQTIAAECHNDVPHCQDSCDLANRFTACCDDPDAVRELADEIKARTK